MSRGALFLLVLGLLAGGTFGYVAGTGTGDGTTYTSESGDAESGYESPPPEEPRYEPEPLPENSRRSLRDLIAALPKPETKRGSGVIQGHVRRLDGTPVSGAVIHATPWRNFRRPTVRGGPPPDDDIERLVKESLEHVLYAKEGRVVARSGGDGAFSLTGLPDSRHRLMAWKQGLVLTTNKHMSRPGEVVDFVAKPVVRVPLTVVTPDGTAPEMGAHIICRMAGRHEGQWWTAEAGAIALEPGTWIISAQAGDNNEMKSDEVDVVVEIGTAADPVTLKLDSKPGIKGTVKFDPTETQTYCEVRVLRILPGKDADPERLKNEGQSTHAWPGNSGAFAFHDLAAGTWLVGLLSNGRGEVYASTTVEVGTALVEVELEFPALDPVNCLTVEVLDPDGKPVSDAMVSTAFRGRGSRGGQTRTVRLEDGSFRVEHPKVDPEKKAADGKYTVTVTSPRFGTKATEYVPTPNGRVTVTFDEPASLAVTVLDYAGSGYEGRISLSVRQVSTGAMNRSMSYSGFGGRGGSKISAEGVQKFGPLTPGEYDVYLTIQTGNRSNTAGKERVVLDSGDNKATIGIPRFHTLTVAVDGAADGGRLRLRARDRAAYGSGRYPAHTYSARTKDGRAVFEEIAAGAYILSGSGTLSGQMEVVVPGQSVVRFDPKPVDAYLVSITDPQGAYARAGLREGDLVIGIDGTEFSDTRQMSALLTLARTKSGSTLSVIRGRSRLTISIDLSKAGTRSSASGGRLTQSSR